MTMRDAASLFACALAIAGCSSSPGPGLTPDGPPADVPDHIPGMPSLGVHTLTYYGLNDSEEPSITTNAIATQPSGGTIVVSVGRGDIGAFARPTDNKGNGAYPQLGTTHEYTHYSSSGTALYARTGAAGGAGFQISATNKPSDEITLAAVEVIEGTKVVDYAWNEVVQPATPVPLTSESVTTTGPATLVAFWWGDAPEPQDKTAIPDSGFTVVDSILKSGALVQCAVAVKTVPGAGTYHVTWTATPVQGAQMWLVAVQ